jgi:hypothetical protein
VHDPVELGQHVGLFAYAGVVRPLAGNEEDRRGQAGRSLADRTFGHFGIERPRLRNDEAGAPQGVDER